MLLQLHTHIISCIIGQKFPSKSLEVSLQATVHFHENPVLSSSNDPFCTGLNAYIDVSLQWSKSVWCYIYIIVMIVHVQLFFKVTDFCLSGCNVEAKSLTLFPSARCKLLTSTQLTKFNWLLIIIYYTMQVGNWAAIVIVFGTRTVMQLLLSHKSKQTFESAWSNCLSIIVFTLFSM